MMRASPKLFVCCPECSLNAPRPRSRHLYYASDFAPKIDSTISPDLVARTDNRVSLSYVMLVSGKLTTNGKAR